MQTLTEKGIQAISQRIASLVQAELQKHCCGKIIVDESKKNGLNSSGQGLNKNREKTLFDKLYEDFMRKEK